MHDILFVHKVEREKHLPDNMGGLLLSKPIQSANFRKKIATCDVLHDNVVVLLVLQELEDASDVGVLDCFENFELVLVELLVNLGLTQLRLFNGLDGARHVCLSV